MLENVIAFFRALPCVMSGEHKFTAVRVFNSTHRFRIVYQCARCGAES